MPEGPDGKTIIVVKKVSGHAGHHGGAWKVAYADFITSMMCLFLVLWLVNSASEPTKQRIASYFRKPGIFQKGSGTPLEIGGGGILPDTFAPPADANSQIIANKKIYQVDAHTGKVKDYFDPGGPKEGGDEEEFVKEQERLKEEAGKGKGKEGEKEEGTGEKDIMEEDLEKLKEDLEKAARGTNKEEGALLGQVDIKVDQRGLLIEIMDTESTSMFEVGSSTIIPAAKEQLLKIAQVLLKLPNPIDIEGHTDSRPYRSKRADDYDNWRLSSDRAHAARRVLQQAGLPDSRIARVVGYADQRPKVPEKLDPSQRRITIAMRFTEQAKLALEGTQTVETAPKSMLKKSEPPVGRPEEATVPAKEATPAPEPTNTDSTNAKGQKELKVEVGTVMPEGPPVKAEEEAPESSNRMEKDKIFGRIPFFQKN